MKKSLIIVTVVLMMFMGVLAFAAAEKGKLDLKVGDERYVCNCGESCPCNTISMNAGKCTCGKDMVKAKVVKVDKGKADFMAEGWKKERSFKTVGKYMCNCSPDCKCGTISQNPGKCTCGSEMKKI
jgi:hypothetical protein